MANPNTDYSTIEPYHFFSSREDKTKFNWFAFEWACEMDRAVPFQLKRYLSKNGYTQQNFNQSCIKLAVLLQGVVLRKLRNEIPYMQISHTEVEKRISKTQRQNHQSITRLRSQRLGKFAGYLCCMPVCVRIE